MCDIMRELYSGSFKAVFDPANFVQCGEDTKNANYPKKEKRFYKNKKIRNKRRSDSSGGKGGRKGVEWPLKQFFKKRSCGLWLCPHPDGEVWRLNTPKTDI